MVCDGFQGDDKKFIQYKLADEDVEAFGKGMLRRQPYQHKVIKTINTPEGWLVIIRDTVKPNPHYFSLDIEFHKLHTCFDLKTRLFTINGIKTFDEVSEGDLVWSIDLKSEQMVLKPIIAKFQYDYNGIMYKFCGSKYNFKITPNHNILCKLDEQVSKKGFRRPLYKKAGLLFKSGLGTKAVSGLLNLSISTISMWRNHKKPLLSRLDENKLQFFKAKEIINRYKFFLPVPNGYKQRKIYEIKVSDYLDQNKLSKDANRINNIINPVDFFRLAGWYIAEGSITNSNGSWGTSIAASSKDAIDEITDIFRKIGAKSNVIKGKTCNCVMHYGFALRELLLQFGRGAQNKKIPTWVKNAQPELLKELFECYIKGDGSRRTQDSCSATTISKQLRDDLIEIGFKLGYYPSFSEKPAGRYFVIRDFYDCKTSWAIYFSKNKGTVCNANGRERKQTLNYKGKIWCVEVEQFNNLLIERNGKMVFSGNSKEHHWTQKEVDRLIRIGKSILRGTS